MSKPEQDNLKYHYNAKTTRSKAKYEMFKVGHHTIEPKVTTIRTHHNFSIGSSLE